MMSDESEIHNNETNFFCGICWSNPTEPYLCKRCSFIGCKACLLKCLRSKKQCPNLQCKQPIANWDEDFVILRLLKRDFEWKTEVNTITATITPHYEEISNKGNYKGNDTGRWEKINNLKMTSSVSDHSECPMKSPIRSVKKVEHAREPQCEKTNEIIDKICIKCWVVECRTCIGAHTGPGCEVEDAMNYYQRNDIELDIKNKYAHYKLLYDQANHQVTAASLAVNEDFWKWNEQLEIENMTMINIWNKHRKALEETKQNILNSMQDELDIFNEPPDYSSGVIGHIIQSKYEFCKTFYEGGISNLLDWKKSIDLRWLLPRRYKRKLGVLITPQKVKYAKHFKMFGIDLLFEWHTSYLVFECAVIPKQNVSLFNKVKFDVSVKLLNIRLHVDQSITYKGVWKGHKLSFDLNAVAEMYPSNKYNDDWYSFKIIMRFSTWFEECVFKGIENHFVEGPSFG